MKTNTLARNGFAGLAGIAILTAALVAALPGKPPTAVPTEGPVVSAVATPAPTAAPPATPTPPAGVFSPAGSLVDGRLNACAVLLADGRVLVAGGKRFSGDFEVSISSAELLNSETDSFSPAGSMNDSRYEASCTRLADGRVLVVGGETALPDSPWHTALTSAELFDPRLRLFTRTGSLHSAHAAHAATLLADGEVLVVGGYGADSLSTYDAEVYNPKSGTFSEVGASKTSYAFGSPGILLPDGKVYSYGFTADTDTVQGSLQGELYDPATKTFALTAPYAVYHSQSVATARLADGRILVVGAGGADGPLSGHAEVYDPSTGAYTATGKQTMPDDNYTVALTLPSGKVLLTAGWYEACGSGPCPIPTDDNTAELYDPATGTFTDLPATAADRQWATVTLLADGRVLLAGGNGNYSPSSSAELFSERP